MISSVCPVVRSAYSLAGRLKYALATVSINFSQTPLHDCNAYQPPAVTGTVRCRRTVLHESSYLRFTIMGFIMRTLLAATLATVFAAGLCTQASAQSAPSADDIIKALKPSTSSGTTRGIRPAGSTPAPAAAPVAAAPVATHMAPVAAPATQTAATAAVPKPTAPAPAIASGPAINIQVQFPSGSADLTQAARDALAPLGKALSSPDLASYKFRIEGHTDTVGSPEANRALSSQRAAAVVEYLEKTFTVDGTRLVAVGRGSDDLAVQTPPQTSEPRNRRVQIVNIGA